MKPLGVEEIGKRPMVVARWFKTNPNGQARPCRNSAKARNSSAVFCTRNFFRLFHLGASMRASWRSLATSIATQTTASGVLCGLIMVGPSYLVNAEHTHSTGDLRLTMTSMASGRFAPFSHAGPPRSLAKPSSFPRCYGPQFIARGFQEFIRIAGMTHVRTSPGYPQSNP